MANAIETAWNAVPEKEWRRFATAGRAALQQDWTYGAANAALGGRTARAVAFRGGDPIAMAQFALKSFGAAGWRALTLATAMRGPIWAEGLSEPDKAQVIKSMIRSRPWGRRAVMLFQPEAGAGDWLGLSGLRRVMTGASTALVDLTADPGALRARQHQKWRNRLVAAERNERLKTLKNGVKLSQYRWLLDEEEHQQKTKGYRGLPVAFTPAYADAAAKRGDKAALTIFRADIDNKRAAAMLFLRHGDAATYHIGWSSEAGRKAGAHNLLLWRAMLGLRSAGVRLLDLGGVNTTTGAGVARFKLGSGGAVATMPGAFV